MSIQALELQRERRVLGLGLEGLGFGASGGLELLVNEDGDLTDYWTKLQ